jgi:site-specific recombinase XerD
MSTDLESRGQDGRIHQPTADLQPMTTTTTALVPSNKFALIKSLVLDTLPSPESRRSYSAALDSFLTWTTTQPAPALTKALVNSYRAHLIAQQFSPSTINLALSAIRKLALEAADNSLIPTATASSISSIHGIKTLGQRTGLWLDKAQTELLLSCPDTYRVKGVRDRAILAVLIGCGLRRGELCGLTVGQVQMRDARWVIVDLMGKGRRLRVVPMPNWTKVAIDAWLEETRIDMEVTDESLLFAAVNKAGQPTKKRRLTQAGVYDIIKQYGADIDVPKLSPHDLRRTYAKLAKKGGAAMDQIQLSLGHSSITTTERYLGTQQDLTDAPCDRLGLKVEIPRRKK